MKAAESVSLVQSLLEEADRAFPKKAVLSPEDIAQLLDCEEKIIYNWMKRSDPTRRPPKLSVGKDVRFPKREFFLWLAEDQGR